MTHRTRQQGVATVVVLVFMTAVVAMTTAVLLLLTQARRSLVLAADRERGLALVEAAVEKALWELARPGTHYAGETNTPFAEGFFTVTARRLDGAPETWDLVATGVLTDELDPTQSRPSSVPELRVRVEIERFGDGRPRHLRTTRWEIVPAKALSRDPKGSVVR